MVKKIKTKNQSLIEVIIEAADEKKAHDIVNIDLSKIESRICDSFIICSAPTAIQVETIANHIEQKVKQTTGESPYLSKGFKMPIGLF